MDYKKKKKLNSLDIQNINARYNLKMHEYEPLSLDELKDLFIKGGISRTDRNAIVATTDMKLKALMNSKIDDVKLEGE